MEMDLVVKAEIETLKVFEREMETLSNGQITNPSALISSHFRNNFQIN
jgi:hypothetical protein